MNLDDKGIKKGFLGKLSSKAKEKLHNFKELSLNQLENYAFPTPQERFDKIVYLIKEAQKEQTFERKQKLLTIAQKISHPMYFKGTNLNVYPSLEILILELILLYENELMAQKTIELYEMLELLNPKSYIVQAKKIRLQQEKLEQAVLLKLPFESLEQNLVQMFNQLVENNYALLQEKESCLFIQQQKLRLNNQIQVRTRHQNRLKILRYAFMTSGYIFSFLTGFWLKRRIRQFSQLQRRFILGGLFTLFLLPLLIK